MKLILIDVFSGTFIYLINELPTSFIFRFYFHINISLVHHDADEQEVASGEI